MPPPDSLDDKRIGVVLLIWAAYMIATGVLDPFLDNFAHLGGLAGGALVGSLVRPTLLAKPSGPSADSPHAVLW